MKHVIYYQKILILSLVLLLLSLIIVTPVNAGFFDKFFKSSSKQVKKETAKPQSNIEQNALKGAEWEKKAEQIICSQKRCVYSLTDANNNLNRYMMSNTFTIVGGKTTKEFINKNNLFGNNFFGKEPDFLEVTQNYGKISKIKIVDAKTSADATRPAQETAFKELCKKTKVPCEVEYAVPKSEASNTGFMEGVCMFAIGNIAPDPVDALCILIAFAK